MNFKSKLIKTDYRGILHFTKRNKSSRKYTKYKHFCTNYCESLTPQTLKDLNDHICPDTRVEDFNTPLSKRKYRNHRNS